jgi:hypothetical protein
VGAIPHPRQSSFCAEAAQYGIIIVSPSTVSPGDVSVIFHLLRSSDRNTKRLNFNANFAFAINSYGHYPEYIDYYINNGDEPPILLARRTLQTNCLSDQFTAQACALHFLYECPELELLELYKSRMRTTSPTPAMR